MILPLVGGNSYKETAKDYAISPQPQRPSKPKPSSSSQRRSSKLINSSGTDLVQSMKRSHPTTPPGSASASPRPRSVSYEAQRSAQKKNIQVGNFTGLQNVMFEVIFLYFSWDGINYRTHLDVIRDAT